MIMEVLLLLSHLALPKEEHQKAAVTVISHLWQMNNIRLSVDLTYSDIDYIVIKKCDWKELYQDAKKAIPMNTPNQQERMLISSYLWTVIMQQIRDLVDKEVVS